MEQRNKFIKSIIGGILIGLGGTCFLSVDNKILGAFLFSIGLYSICCTGQLLFTGRASYTNKYSELLLILIGNFIGTLAIGVPLGFLKPELHEKAVAVCQNKLNVKGFEVAILCNLLIYFAVEGYKHNQSILLIMCVMAFILCGFEHSIADMYYFAVARMYKPVHLLYLLTIVLGNFVGGQLVFGFRKVLGKN